jgi:hypothetical protein
MIERGNSREFMSFAVALILLLIAARLLAA